MSEEKTYERFDVTRRIEHLLLVISFFILGLTGLVQMFSQWEISKWTVSFLGGIEFIRIVHRVCAAFLMFETIYHLVVAGYKVFVQRQDASMLPSMKDIRDFIQAFFHNIGVFENAPKMKRYNFVEKAEYWAMVWGFIVMGVTGFMLWNPIVTAKFLPGEIIPAAKAAHGGEALLAVLAIILWHFYSVHIKSWNWSMITGTLSREEMEEEHILELEVIESGRHVVESTEAETRRRRMVYYPAASVVSAVLLVGVYAFLTIEETSLTTLPPSESNVAVYVPQTPTPIPTRTHTPVPQETEVAVVSTEDQTGLSWNDPIAEIFVENCQSCHGTMGGLSFETFEDMIQGGDSGLVIVPGDSTGSLLVQQQQEGGHMGQFSANDLDLVIQWIDAGAPEASEGTTTEPEIATSEPEIATSEPEIATTEPEGTSFTWEEDVQGYFEEKCLLCHGEMGGLSVESYADLMAGGDSGPVIISGDAEGSPLVQLMNAGEHMAQFSPEELEVITSWIDEGALEAGEATTSEPEGTSFIWGEDVQGYFEEKCLSCHGEMGGLSVESYSDLMAGGNNGPVIIPGDSAQSSLVVMQSEGEHMGQFTEEELDLIISWIDAGALEE
jgi:cytochrome b subunit of formate dehydrogenase/mono/diheme cytochrome c family protein